MPLRVRLTLWYGTALALVLVVFGGALYAILARGLRDQIDRSLEEAASVAVRAVEQHGIGPFLPFEDLAAEFPELAVLDKTFQIFSPAGKITIQSPNLRRQDIPLSPTALASALDGGATLESARFQDGSSFRLLSVPIQEAGVLVNIVQVGTALRPVEEMLRRLVVVLLVSAPIALAAALGGGWFLADRALRPVEAITQAAQRIAAGDLTQRLAVPATSDEIGRLAATFNDMIARLEASFRQVRQFSADASHELRTPLTVIKGEAELALRRPRPAEDYKLVLESTLEEVDRMTQIVDELLFLSRADLGEVAIESLPVRLDALVEDIRRQAAVLGQEQGVQVTVGAVEPFDPAVRPERVEGDGWPQDRPLIVMGDELRLRELLLNLVDNAVKYSKPGGKVEIALVREGATARLSVTDQGIGIAPEEQGRIFDRFYRTDAARAHAKKGTGLGLSICKWIAEAHHGRIEVQSQVGEGSRFTVVLPLAT
jgi:two-component system OmpR family sensor kinase